MLATLVIGLREGLEASLIIGIIAAFLAKQGRTDALRQVWAGVGVAVLICLGVGIGLKIASNDLPQRQQEGLETVVGAAAVLMVTYMVVWMRRNSRGLKRQLEGAAGSALASGSTTALVAMAFLAVLREGFETAVFLLAAFNESSNPATATAGAVIGIAVAIGLGYGIYRGGVHLNLSKFFRGTGLVLVLVAAGLVVSGIHTAHEAGWLTAGQRETVNLSWLVAPGSIRASLLTGVLGLQERPTVIEVVGWLVYLVPVGLYVGWPPGRPVVRTSPRQRMVSFIGAGAPVLVALGLAAAIIPARAEAGTTGTAPSTSVSSARTVTVTLTNDGCAVSAAVVRSGALTFDVVNADATGVTETELLSGGRIIGEKENLAPGFSGSFALRLGAGHYSLYCPGATHDTTPFTVVGSTTPAGVDVAGSLARQGTVRYAGYVRAQTAKLVQAVAPLAAAIHRGDLSAARRDYAAARPFYERVEPVAESFADAGNNLDSEIDARVNDVPRSQFQGFHRIELGLFEADSTAGLDGYAGGLVSNVGTLDRLVSHLTYQPAQLANGAVGLLDEIAKTKVTGEEERYSHLDVLDLRSNVEGSQTAYRDLRPALRLVDPSLATVVDARFATVDSDLKELLDPSALGGVEPYGRISASDVRSIAEDVQALAEPLSEVAAHVVTA